MAPELARRPELQEESACTVSRPPLKWAGGKRWLLPHLQELWGPHRRRRLIEPFCGGLAVALGLRPERALLNDINPHAINFYRRLAEGLEIRIPMRNESALYYAHRARFNELIQKGQAGSEEAAGLFYYLNRTGYNGLCRFNSRGLFNVPYGRHKTINYMTDLASYRAAFAGWQFRCGDFTEIQVASDDFIYADPPYDVEFTQYAKEDFTWMDQVRLVEWLSAHGGPVLASNQATTRMVALYEEAGFEVQVIEAPRMISCTGDRSRALEMLATKNV